MKPRYITVQPFDLEVRILLTKKEWREHKVPKGAMAACMVRNEQYMLALPRKYDEPATWHEAHHLARWLNEAHGVLTDVDNHEADVYLMEHIVREVKRLYKE